jgi:protein-disulfide isomerase
MKRPYSFVSSALILAVLAGLAACAAPGRMEQLQSDLTALRADVAALTDRFDRLNRQLSPPEPPRVSIGFAGRPVLGERSAGIGIVEFSDFECPFCRRFHATVHPLLKQEYIDTGKVQMIFRDLPLDFHPRARGAALAANCVGEQGQYWNMVDALFDAQDSLGDELYRELAGKFGVDMGRFQACLQDAASVHTIEQSLQEAAAFGIDGTPTFLIGRVEGERLVDAHVVVGAQPYPALAQLIDSFLETPAALGRTGAAAK